VVRAQRRGLAARVWGAALGFAVLFVMALGWCSPAAAAPAWLTPVLVPNAGSQSVATDQAGDVVTVWGAVGPPGGSASIWAAVRPAGGSWQPPVQLAAVGKQYPYGPDVAVDPQGDAVVVWDTYQCAAFDNPCTYGSVEAVVGSIATGRWQAPGALGDGSATSSGSLVTVLPRVAVDHGGDAVAVWNYYDGSSYTVHASRRLTASGAWSTPVTISGTSASDQAPAVASDAAGDAVAVFSSGTASMSGANGTWSAPVGGAFGGDVGMDDRGDAVAVWIGTSQHVFAAVKPAASGTWQLPVDLSGGDTAVFAEDPRVEVGPNGQAAAVWQVLANSTVTVQGAAGSALTGSWEPTATLSAASASDPFPEVAVGGTGASFAVWKQYTGSGSSFTVQAAVRSPGTNVSWHAATNISSQINVSNTPALVAADAQGNAVAVWPAVGGAQAAGYDGAGPKLQGLSIPSTGVAGQPLSFSVSPFDVWSPLGATSWSFGDGSGAAAGTSVGHTFKSAGKYQVTVTGADSLGNATSISATVTIGPRFPSITHARESHRVWREGRRLASISRRRRPPVGTVFSFALNETAQVTLNFGQRLGGRRVKRRCVAPTRGNRHGKRCTRTLQRGMIAFHAHAGANRVSFDGRLSRAKRLKPGRYAVSISATDVAGRHSHPVTLRFKVVK
jgi:PKD domain